MANQNDVQSWGSIAQWVSAGATLSAVAVALFKDEFFRWRRRPLLGVSIKPGPPDCSKTILSYQVQRVAMTFVRAEYYSIRLWIANDGRSRAEQVQVFVSQLLKQSADGSYRKVDSFLPMNLRWSHGTDPHGVPEIFADGISPGMGKHCDFGHVVALSSQADLNEVVGESPDGRTVFALDLEIIPTSKTHLIPPGKYKLELRVAGSNTRASSWTVNLNLTGEWHDTADKMFTDGIGVSVAASKNGIS